MTDKTNNGNRVSTKQHYDAIIDQNAQRVDME